MPLCVRKAKAFPKAHPANLCSHLIDHNWGEGRASQLTVLATSANRVTVRTDELVYIKAFCKSFTKDVILILALYE